MHKLIKMLESFTNVMDTVARSENDTLHMPTLVNTEHECGTSACICGHAALIGDLFHFSDRSIEGQIELIRTNHNNPSDHIHVADMVLEDLFDEPARYEEFGVAHILDPLVRSIVESYEEDRYILAKKSGLFKYEELESFKHLDGPSSPTDAAIYLRACIEKIKEMQDSGS